MQLIRCRMALKTSYQGGGTARLTTARYTILGRGAQLLAERIFHGMIPAAHQDDATSAKDSLVLSWPVDSSQTTHHGPGAPKR